MLRTDLDPLPRLRVEPEPPGRGVAKAVHPVVAAAVATGIEGLEAGPVTIDSNGFAMPAYRAKPAGGERLPIVLVVSEIFGVHEHIADVARRFARHGYLAIAPELFVRQGDAKAVADIETLMATVVSRVPDAQVMSDLDACVAWAATQEGDTARLGVTGFCWGGRQTWLYAAHNPAVRGGVAWYGRLTGATNERQTGHPLELAAGLKAPVLGLYGGADTGIPLDTVEAMRRALEAGSEAAKRSEIVVYPEAKHAFFADYRPSYDPASAADGWQRCLGWLRAHGAA
ncbi:MAG: dienelactone hydrolase family protein [Caldimonas sp.]